MSNTFGSCENGSAAAPTMVATIRIRVRFLRCLLRIWLMIHSSTRGYRRRQSSVGAQLVIAVSGDSATVCDGTGRSGLGGRVVHDGLASKSSKRPSSPRLAAASLISNSARLPHG